MTRNRADVDVEVEDPVAAAIRALVGRTTELVEASRGLALNHVLYSGTILIPAVGYESLEFSVPMAAVMVNASDSAGDVAAASAPPTDPAPTYGKGVVTVSPGAMLTVPMTGPTLTIYGAAGDLVYVAVWTRAQPPAGA